MMGNRHAVTLSGAVSQVETMLLQHFEVDGKYFEDKYGVPVKGMKDEGLLVHFGGLFNAN